MTKKIPLAIDTKPLAQAIDKSVNRTMTKRTMTKRTMTKRAMTKRTMTKAFISVIEGALVGLAAVVAWGMLVTLFSL